MVGGVDEIEADFALAPHEKSGPLAISVPRDFGLGFLSHALLNFKARHPGIQLIVDFDDRQVDLARENYDMAIRISPDPTLGVLAKQLGKTCVRFYASPGYLTKHGVPKEPCELKDNHVVGRGMANRTRMKLFNSGGKSVTVELVPVLNTNSGVFMREAAVAGHCIAGLPGLYCRPGVE